MIRQMQVTAAWCCVLFQVGLAQAQPLGWMLLSRESGCLDLHMLARMERLPQVPSSPDEFAAMMRARNHTVTMTLPAGFPPKWAGKAVMVKYAENRAPVFLRTELCAARTQSDSQRTESALIPRPR